MERKELLKKYHDMACHNLMCYSKTYLMTEAKEGFKEEWQETQEEIKLLEEMMAELDCAIQEETAQEVIIHGQLQFNESGELSEEIVTYCRQNNMYTAELLTGRPLPEGFPIQR